MLPFLVTLPLAFTSAPVKVMEINLEHLVCYSDRIVVGRVDDVVKVDRGSPQDGQPPTVSIADVTVLRTLKGEEGPRVLYPAHRTWVCDTTQAVLGETVLLFLTEERVFRDEEPELRVNVRDRLGDHPLLRVVWSGRGRMPFWRNTEGERVVYWGDVRMPEDLAAGPGPDAEKSWVHSLPIEALEQRIEEMVVAQRETVLRAVAHYPGGRGVSGLGWTLEVHADRTSHLSVQGLDGNPERERSFTVPATLFMRYHMSLLDLCQRPWTGSIGTTDDPTPRPRTLHLNLPDREATIRIYEVDEREMEDPEYALETRNSLRLWGAVRAFFGDADCVDLRALDARWVADEW